jgi:AcrR family transcriptional regulator
MKDVIKETGLSPGAVYASFSDIDEVIAALVNRKSAIVNIKEEVEQILQNASTPIVKIERLCGYFHSLIYTTSTTLGKFIFELNIVATDSKRKKKLEDNLHEDNMLSYVLDTLIGVINENIESGYFSPKTSKESIYALIFAFIDGFIRDYTFAKCYGMEIPHGVTFEERDLPKAFSDSIIFLLNPTDGGVSI